MKPDPQTDQRLCGLLGMARRAGRLITGFDAVCTLVAKHKAQVVLLASDVSAKTAKEVRYAAHNGPAVRTLPFDKAAVGQALGFRKPIGVLALNDPGFAAAVKALCSPADPPTIEEE